MADKKNLPPQPKPLKEGEVMPGQKKDKEWLREREAAPVPEPVEIKKEEK